MQFCCSNLQNAEVRIKQKVALKYAAADVNLGNKKEQVALVKVAFAPRNGDGGGTVFGPTPRSYSFKLPKKVRRLAIKSALSSKVIDNDIIVLDQLAFAQPKTKEFAAILNNLKVARKALDCNCYLRR